NDGHFTFGGSNILSVSGSGQAFKFFNRTTGVFDIQLAASGNVISVSSGSAAFINKGNVFKSGAATRSTMTIAYVDSGFTAIQTDTLEFTGSSNFTGQVIFSGAQPHVGQLYLTGGTDTITTSAIFSGAGHVALNGA